MKKWSIIKKKRGAQKMKQKREKGITLIALVITIIILLILAGISIATLTGENGILSKAGTAKEETIIKSYQEQLEIIWMGVKVGNTNTNTSYEEMLKQAEDEIERDSNFEGSTAEIIDNIIEVTTKEGYIFHIIDGKVEYVGKSGEEKGDITVNLVASEIQNKKVSFTATAIGASGRKMTYILYVGGEEKQRVTSYKTTFTFDEQTTTFGETMEAYVEIKYEDEKTAKSNEVTVEDTTIANENEFATFRDKVNAGNTYEGKTIQLIDNIDLVTICGGSIGSFTPIGAENINFKGTFDGNYHTISNLYISEGKENLGLFLTVDEKATIKKVKFENVDILNTISTSSGYAFTGTICGNNYGTIEEIGITTGQVVSKYTRNSE